MVSTLDFESSDPSSNLGGTLLFSCAEDNFPPQCKPHPLKSLAPRMLVNGVIQVPLSWEPVDGGLNRTEPKQKQETWGP